ncbi:glutathione peroxidase [Simiduia sp. 21SJ11W-1]|uniref:glutathione peroxidase n=1 Tax=Simiduia sp. 21SJ11W-1 TaxID=2909669 RepID=UPI00209EE2EA|nr:glutathione peroxidase [Simiduia sp. 21SJ11W-1]UTA47614.1 glutathione peroxidase [Simiduia sp. 21SJ11W-1]
MKSVINLLRCLGLSVLAACAFAAETIGAEPGAHSASAMATKAALASSRCPAFLNQPYRALHATHEVNLCELFAGKVLLLVNTASHCGYTKQFRALEALHQRYHTEGLAVVGFASNDFNQEAADEEKSADICFVNFGVTFTMLAPTHVKGPHANVTFNALAKQTQPPAWNFNKYLLSADGQQVQYFPSKITPDSAAIITAIETALLARNGAE